MQEEINHVLEFSKYAKQHLIPTQNGIVTSQFIDFVYESSLEDFIEQFHLAHFFPEQIDDEEFMKGVRQEATTAIISQIADINKDFFSYSIIGNNNIFNLIPIVEGLGFELILKNNFKLSSKISKEEYERLISSNIHSNSEIVNDTEGDYVEISTESIYYYHNKNNGLLWTIETRRGYFVVASVLYGNSRDRIGKKEMKWKFKDSSRLAYSDVYGFSYDMRTLPINEYEQLIVNLEFVSNWLIIPSMSFIEEMEDDTGLLNYLDKVNDKSIDMLFGYIVDNHKKEQFSLSNKHYIDPKIFSHNQNKLKKELFMVDFLFDAYMNTQIYYKYFERKGFNMTREEINHFIYNYFNDKSLSFKKIKEDDFVEFINLFDTEDIKLITPKIPALTHGFGLSENVAEFIRVKSDNKTLQ